MVTKAKASRFGYSHTIWTWITTFLVLDFALNLVWMLTVPMALAPDEQPRMILSDYIFFNGRLPNAWEEAVRIGGWGFSYALRPMLVNIIGAFNMRLVSLFTSDPWALVLSVRIVSAISGVVMVYFCFRICEWLEWKPCWAFLLGFVCALTPQVTFLCGYNNNDVFSMACVTAILYCWIRGMKQNWPWADCFRLAIALGLAILSYYNAYPYVLFSIPLFLMTAFHRYMTKAEFILALQKTLAITGITFLIAGWWFLRNIYLYDGDVLGIQTRLVMGEMFASPELRPSVIFKPYRNGISFFDLWNYNNGDPFTWSEKTFFSSIALLGNMDFLFPSQIYDFAAQLLGIGLILFVCQYATWVFLSIWNQIHHKRVNRQTHQHMLFFFFAALSAIMVVGLSMYYSWTDDFQPQGRYIMPSFTTFALMMCGGYRLMERVLALGFGQEKAGLFPSWFFCLCICAIMIGGQAYAYERIRFIYLNDYPRLTNYYLNHRQKYRKVPKPTSTSLPKPSPASFEEMEEEAEGQSLLDSQSQFLPPDIESEKGQKSTTRSTSTSTESTSTESTNSQSRASERYQGFSPVIPSDSTSSFESMEEF